MGTIARRLLQLVVVVILSTLFAFALLRLFPGDVADAVLPYGTAAQKAKFRAENGLDKRWDRAAMIAGAAATPGPSASDRSTEPSAPQRRTRSSERRGCRGSARWAGAGA